MAIDKAAEDQYDRWLQTEFAADLAHRLVASSQVKTHKERTKEAAMVSKCHAEKVFARFPIIPPPWRPNISLYRPFGKVHDETGLGGPAIKVLASSQLMNIVVHLPLYKKEKGDDHDPIQALNALLRSCFEMSHLIFNGTWSPYWLLHQSQYILDKAFVRAVIAVSRWLGEERFPDGLYGLWPPPAPADYSFAG